jgi:hypothetical protein
MFELARLQRKVIRLSKSAGIKAQEITKETNLEARIEPGKLWLEALSVQNEVDKFYTKRLIKTANHLGLPMPSLNDESSWEADIDNKRTHHHLTRAAQAQLRNDIRQEQKERREEWTAIIKDLVVPIGGIIISVLSLLIAYAALKLKH